MKKTLSILVLLIGLLFSFTLTSCKEKTDFNVGVCQLVQHAALDEATKGFQDALNAEMEKVGKTITIDYQNAQGDSAVCTTIVSKFVNKKYDLIMANATPALEAAYNRTTTIPVLGTSITTYTEALHITLNADGSTGKNVSGTSDLCDLSKQADMITEWMPNAKTVGIIYCSSEANSLYQVTEITKCLQAKSITVKAYPFADSNDVKSVAELCASEVDCVYVPTDNTAASNQSLLDSTFRKNKVPVFAGDSNLCKASEGSTACAVASFSISYYNIGYETGLMAARILLNGEKVENMPISYDQSPVKKYNSSIATELGLTVPAGYTEIGE